MGIGIKDPSIVNPVFWDASPANIYMHNESQGGGDTYPTGGSNWIERDGFRFDPTIGVMERNTPEFGWSPLQAATRFYDPNGGVSTNERLQLALAMANAPSGTSMDDMLGWAVTTGNFHEPSHSDGMTLGEALLLMGGTAFGAGAFNGMGAAGGTGQAAATAAASPGSLAAEWATLEGTPTLVMGGDVAAGGLGAFTSADGFAGAPTFVDDAMQQGTGLNSPDTPWNTLNRTLNQTLAENPMLKQGLDALKTTRSVVNGYNTLDNLYDAVTSGPEAPPAPQGSPLQQVQSEPGRGYMSQAFGNRNFDAYR